MTAGALTIAKCVSCGASFNYVRGRRGRRRSFCSVVCRRAHFRRSNKVKICASCGASFRVRYLTKKERGIRGRFCSAKCWQKAQRRYATKDEAHAAAAHRRRARLRGANHEQFTAAEIFERDCWRCGLCGKRVDKRLRRPHPMRASLDHITPLSDGGHHVRSNVQCSHWICNSRKSHGPGGQLRLFG